jgi:hypothetical protein
MRKLKFGDVYYAALIVLALSMVACDLNLPGSSTIINTATNNNAPPPTPGASPSPAAGSCPGAALVDHVRVNPFGYDCSGNQAPPNSSGLLPMGCIAAVTATPKDAQGNDVPSDLHGPSITWSVTIGGSYIQVTDDPLQPFNKNVRAVSAPGEFQLAATVCGKTGAWNGRTVASFP